MNPAKRYVLVEGHGEIGAMENLLTRMSHRIADFIPWARPLRWVNLHQWESDKHGGVRNGVEHIRLKDDAASLLIVRDEDDGCPREIAPALARQIRTLETPFPVAYVLLKPEYEVLFLPCIGAMCDALPDGRQGLRPGTRWDGVTWEARRGIKEWLSGHFPKGRSYKPTLDQLPFTRKINLDDLAAADVPCFGTLQRALAFLAHPECEAGDVYPADEAP